MLNHELLLAAGGEIQEPVRASISFLSGFGVNVFGVTTSSTIDKVPVYIATNGKNVGLKSVQDSYGDGQLKSYLYTQLVFPSGTLLDIDSFRVTRVDTKETVELYKKEIPYAFMSTLSTPFFHDLKKGDTVELLFYPPPVDYR
jgi:hypothetical protein